MPLIEEEEDNLEYWHPTLILDDNEEEAAMQKDEDSDCTINEEAYVKKDLDSITDELVDDTDSARASLNIINYYALFHFTLISNSIIFLVRNSYDRIQI